MLCKECWEKAGKPYHKYYKVYLRHACWSPGFKGVCRGLDSKCGDEQ